MKLNEILLIIIPKFPQNFSNFFPSISEFYSKFIKKKSIEFGSPKLPRIRHWCVRFVELICIPRFVIPSLKC